MDKYKIEKIEMVGEFDRSPTKLEELMAAKIAIDLHYKEMKERLHQAFLEELRDIPDKTWVYDDVVDACRKFKDSLEK
jgi:hypothetical protein